MPPLPFRRFQLPPHFHFSLFSAAAAYYAIIAMPRYFHFAFCHYFSFQRCCHAFAFIDFVVAAISLRFADYFSLERHAISLSLILPLRHY